MKLLSESFGLYEGTVVPLETPMVEFDRANPFQ